MNPKGIGVSVGASNGHLSELKQALDYAQSAGYPLVEIGLSSLNLIINGRLIPRLRDDVANLLKQYDFHYTLHAPNRTNLAFGYDLTLEYAILEACIQFGHVINADILVYHSGLQALEYPRTGFYPLPDADEMQRGAEREVAALTRLAPYAADHGVTICMENGDPHHWEFEVIRRYGRSDSDLVTYHPRLTIPPIVEQVKAVNHPGVGMTLDLAHLHIAAHTLGFDYLEAIKQAAPYTTHLHLNDNFGKLDSGFDAGGPRAPYGEADLHLPPGWGTIPYQEAFARLPDFNGYIIIEIKYRYAEYFAEARETIEGFIEQM